jgi:NAD(P)H-hydrate repair Nnr-like enzyme with NAD(P)H-hydrate epimerase domain
MPRDMIGEIRESYGDDEKIDRRPHSFVWEGEGRRGGDEYGAGEMLSFVRFVSFIASQRKYRRSKRRK